MAATLLNLKTWYVKRSGQQVKVDVQRDGRVIMTYPGGAEFKFTSLKKFRYFAAEFLVLR